MCVAQINAGMLTDVDGNLYSFTGQTLLDTLQMRSLAST